jgi:hypothetical protein
MCLKVDIFACEQTRQTHSTTSILQSGIFSSNSRTLSTAPMLRAHITMSSSLPITLRETTLNTINSSTVRPNCWRRRRRRRRMMRRRKEAKTRNDLTKLVYAYIYIMHREQSLSKLSSRSLSKIKTKIDLAFSRPVNNENRSKNGQNLMPSRSKSTKSLGKSKCEPSDNTIPFAIAIKSGLVQTDRKSSALQTPIKRPVNSLKGSETRKE